MPLNTLKATNELKAALVKEYGGFADRRIKKLESGDFFHVDDRGGSDYDARKRLFNWFCTIDLVVCEGEKVKVIIGNALPQNNKVEQWWKENSIKGNFPGMGCLKITPKKIDRLDELADLVEKVRPDPYNKAYYYTVPRTVNSLRRLKETLAKVWDL